MGVLQKHLRNLKLHLIFNSHYETGSVMGLYGVDVGSTIVKCKVTAIFRKIPQMT